MKFTLKILLQRLCWLSVLFYMAGCASIPSVQKDKDSNYFPPKGLIPLKIIGGEVLGSTGLNHPQGIAIEPSGNFYIVDSGNNRLVKCNKEGEFIKEIGGFGWGDGEFNLPGYANMDNGLSLYVTDTQNRRVQRFDNYLNFVQSINSLSEENFFENSLLNGIVLSRSGELYLSDSENDCIWKTDPQFISASKFGGFESGAGAVNDPQGMAIDKRGNLYVADSGNDRIAIYDLYGNYLGELGRGILDRPFGVEAGRDGLVYVANTFGDNIVALDKNGSIVFEYGKRGRGEGEFDKPKDLKLFEDEKLYIVDSGNNRIQLLMLVK
ncbi:MAG: NHL repeat-containing protein [candidate division Zixibacteria bacterium]|nr:NHL repeat-containing protein [candidate division Zixibacteria bacterium]